MGKQILQENDDKIFLDNLIKLGDKFFQKIPIAIYEQLKVNLVNLQITELQKDFTIDARLFINKIATIINDSNADINLQIEYLKIYFIQNDSNCFSICFSISSEKDVSMGINDSFFIIRNGGFESIPINDFVSLHKTYKDNLLKRINFETKVNNTEVISYKLKDVYLFIINHILIDKYTHLLFETIQFKTADTNRKANMIGLAILATDSVNTNLKGSPYDFGTIYP